MAGIALNLDGLSDEQKEMLSEIIATFKQPKEYWVAPDSDIVPKRLLESFGDTLRVHHCFSGESFTKDKFEWGLIRHYKKIGIKAEKSPNTHRGPDIHVVGVPWSLKTQADKKTNPDFIHISKYMELGKGDWADRIEHLHGLRDQFLDHLSLYKRILILRKLREKPNYFYELVEIPKSLLELAGKLGEFEFSERSRLIPKTGYCHVKKGERLLFNLYFDGGGERKLHVKDLDKSLCKVHATWEFQVEINSGVV